MNNTMYFNVGGKRISSPPNSQELHDIILKLPQQDDPFIIFGNDDSFIQCSVLQDGKYYIEYKQNNRLYKAQDASLTTADIVRAFAAFINGNRLDAINIKWQAGQNVSRADIS
ncbi:MAG TPA: hypothetical protein VMF29_08265, partial [Candidatus Edwardsbacteria bacterium]|nr:hypothetical protein [Candidatus Edwardsbacteria bacterium]